MHAELGYISFCIFASLFFMPGYECATNTSRTARRLYHAIVQNYWSNYLFYN